MATSPNFNWPEPDNTDLVKNGALAIRTAVDAIDSSLVDLKGGTTGQVLSKASNTDMDFVWAADAGAPTSLGYAAGKNKIINGDFGIWQRGTTFSNPASLAYTADRFAIFYDGTGATRTISQQTFTPGAAPVAGYEGKFFYRYAVSVAGSGNTANLLRQYIEDVRTFAGQTVTVSFWAKAGSSLTIPTVGFTQNFGTGGSPSAGVDTTIASSVAVTTSWQRFTYSVAVPSISGKTLGTAGNDALELRFFLPSGASTFTFDIWGVQVEAGSTATAFQTATGTIQGELAACKYYYDKRGGQAGTGTILNSALSNSAGTNAAFNFPITMRSAPNSVEYSNLRLSDTSSGFTVSSVTLTNSTPTTANVNVATTGMTAFRSCYLDSSATGNFIAFSAEL